MCDIPAFHFHAHVVTTIPLLIALEWVGQNAPSGFDVLVGRYLSLYNFIILTWWNFLLVVPPDQANFWLYGLRTVTSTPYSIFDPALSTHFYNLNYFAYGFANKVKKYVIIHDFRKFHDIYFICLPNHGLTFKGGKLTHRCQNLVHFYIVMLAIMHIPPVYKSIHLPSPPQAAYS